MNSNHNSTTQENKLSTLKASYTWLLTNFTNNYCFSNPIVSPDFQPTNNNKIKFNMKLSFKTSSSSYLNVINGPQLSDILLTLLFRKNQTKKKIRSSSFFRGENVQNVNAEIDIPSNAQSRPKLLVSYRISFLDSLGQKHHSQEGRAVFNNNNNPNSSTTEEPIEGWEYRISYEYLREMYRQNCYPTIRILCEILNLKGFNEIESPFEQTWQYKTIQPESEIEILIENQTKSNEALDHYQALLNSGTLSDVVLVVGKKEFQTHKAILAARSSVFAAMFTNDLNEEKLKNRVVIPDLNVEVCELLLPYIYTGKVPSMEEYALELFFASDKYQLDHLKSICEQNLIKTLSIQTVAHTLLLADMHSAAYLKRKCVEYITQNSEQVMATKGWIEMTKARPELLMELYKDISAKANPLLKRTG